jgi:Holliday junction resolvase
MVNKLNNYKNGRAREYRIMNNLRLDGFEVFRTAGSHGCFDLIAFNFEEGILNLIQVKPISMSDAEKARIKQSLIRFERGWKGKISVISTAGDLER